jgi:predicted AAA+ superfamily ATPase
MRDYIVDKKEDIKGLDVFERAIDTKFSEEFANTIIGPRRAGKTFFLYSLIKKLKLRDEEFLFVNFEDDEVKSFGKEAKKCIQIHTEIYGREPKYLFFDEVQNLDGWQSFLYSLIEKKKYCVFASGSSSKLLSREISTQLRGRGLNVIVFPFSFKEFLRVKNFKIKNVYPITEKAVIKNYLNEYLKFGGFPQVALKKIDAKIFFREYTNVVLYKDLIERYNIASPDVARLLIYSVVQSYTKEFSINNIYKQLKEKAKVSNKTIYQYFSYLEEVFFSFSLRKFNFSYKKSFLSIPKVYINDAGLVSGLGFRTEIGKLMENVVFLELKKLELNNVYDLFYWKDYQQREVDFVLSRRAKPEKLIQVTYASNRDEIEKREVSSLLKASEQLGCRDLIVITWDYEGEEEIEKKKIKFIPLWKWLTD